MPKEIPTVTHGGIHMATNPNTAPDGTLSSQSAHGQAVNKKVNRLESSNFFKMSGMPKFGK